ncbi:hypothetical protein HI914_06474 [Erysiphe necator]|nr:hypothetical protein HI914_06474 [Erysiphe necator]
MERDLLLIHDKQSANLSGLALSQRRCHYPFFRWNSIDLVSSKSSVNITSIADINYQPVWYDRHAEFWNLENYYILKK